MLTEDAKHAFENRQVETKLGCTWPFARPMIAKMEGSNWELGGAPSAAFRTGKGVWRGGAGRMAENFGRMDGHVALRYSGEQNIACELCYF